MIYLTRRELLAGAVATGLLKAAALSDVRLGVTTDEIDEDPAIAADFLKRFGLHGAEIRSVWGKYNTLQPLEQIKELRATLDARQIKTLIADTAFFRGQVPEAGPALDKEWALLDAAMDRGDILGCKVLRVFSFMAKDGKTGDTSVYPRTYELLAKAAEKAQARGFTLAVENLKGSYVQTGADLARMLKAVPSPALGANWDPNNAASCGEKSFPDGYRMLDPKRIHHVHLRDFKHKPDGTVEWAAVGTGEFDNLGQIRALRKDGYKGTYSLETHWRDPKGKAYSTEVSLTALLKVVAEV